YSRRQRRSGKIPEEFQGQAEAQFPPAWRSHAQNDRILRCLAHEEIHGPHLQGHRTQHLLDWSHGQNRANLGRSQSQRPRRRNPLPPLLVGVEHRSTPSRQGVSNFVIPSAARDLLLSDAPGTWCVPGAWGPVPVAQSLLTVLLPFSSLCPLCSSLCEFCVKNPSLPLSSSQLRPQFLPLRLNQQIINQPRLPHEHRHHRIAPPPHAHHRLKRLRIHDLRVVHPRPRLSRQHFLHGLLQLQRIPHARTHLVRRRPQRARQHRRRLPLLRIQIHIPRRQCQPVRLAHDRAEHDLRVHIQIPHHLLHHPRLLC